PGHFARRRRKRDERLRPTQRAVTPADGGASFSARSRRRLLAAVPSRYESCRAVHTIHAMPSSRTRSRAPDGGLSINDAAARAGVSPGTLRRWVREGLIPHDDGAWSTGAVGHARIVARLRERGHSL